MSNQELVPRRIVRVGGCEVQPLVGDPLFAVDVVSLKPSHSVSWPTPHCLILGVVEGEVTVTAGGGAVQLCAGGTSLVPACVDSVTLTSSNSAES